MQQTQVLRRDGGGGQHFNLHCNLVYFVSHVLHTVIYIDNMEFGGGGDNHTRTQESDESSVQYTNDECSTAKLYVSMSYIMI